MEGRELFLIAYRLHDMRSRTDVECTYWDTAFDMPVYSLAVQGRERLVAGRARHR